MARHVATASERALFGRIESMTFVSDTGVCRMCKRDATQISAAKMRDGSIGITEMCDECREKVDAICEDVGVSTTPPSLYKHGTEVPDA